jgi:hypothetical protein
MISRITKITLLLLLISNPAWATAFINGEEVAAILTDTNGNAGGVYLLFNFCFTFLMKYVFAPVVMFKLILIVLTSGGSDGND